jgi:hypothetical protein
MRVSLSTKGIQIVELLNKAYVDIHKEILEDIDESQHQPLITAMTNLLSALDRWISRT